MLCVGLFAERTCYIYSNIYPMRMQPSRIKSQYVVPYNYLSISNLSYHACRVYFDAYCSITSNEVSHFTLRISHLVGHVRCHIQD